MNHPTEQLLSAYYDNELPADERAAIAVHLVQCKACELILQDFAAVTEQMGSAALPEPSIAAQAMWMNSFRATRQLGRDRGVRQLAGLLTAAAAIVIAVSMAMPSNAQATAAPAQWEKVAVSGSADVGTTPQATAQWIVADLSAGNGGVQ